MPIAPLLSGPVRVLVVATIAALAAGCRDTNQYVPPPPPSVSVAHPVVRNVTRYFELTGNTKAFAAVDLEARVQGFLEGISYTDGAVVKKGAPLFSIQRNTYEAQLKQAQGALAAQQAALANAQSEYQRQFTLGRQEFASQARVEDAKTKLDQATAAVLEAQANLDIAAINLGYTQVSAPFDGVVTNHLVDVVALVGISGPTKLAQLVRIDPLYIYFNVGEQQVLRVKQHLLATQRTLGDLSKIPVEIGLQDEAGYPHTGKLDYLAPQVDPSTGTLLARALIDNADHALLPGLFVRVRIPVGRDDKALLVRDDAIGTNQQGSYLLTVGADDTVSQRVVTLGPRDGRERVIQTGLKPDEWVVTDGIQRAIPGAKVAPRKVAPADASADPAAIRR